MGIQNGNEGIHDHVEVGILLWVEDDQGGEWVFIVASWDGIGKPPIKRGRRRRGKIGKLKRGGRIDEAKANQQKGKYEFYNRLGDERGMEDEERRSA